MNSIQRCLGFVFFAASLSTQSVAEKLPGKALPATTYASLLSEIRIERSSLARRYRTQTNPHERAKLLKEASLLMRSELVQRVFPHWYGTAWDFNGTSETPKQGKVACGYFVSTSLRDIGLKINRYRIAQLYSHDIVKRLGSDILRFRSRAHMIEHIQSRGDELYVVGLDQHVGFLHKDPRGVYFVHSSYGSPQEVVSELASTSKVLDQSKLWVLGTLSGNTELLKHWLLDQKL